MSRRLLLLALLGAATALLPASAGPAGPAESKPLYRFAREIEIEPGLKLVADASWTPGRDEEQRLERLAGAVKALESVADTEEARLLARIDELEHEVAGLLQRRVELEEVLEALSLQKRRPLKVLDVPPSQPIRGAVAGTNEVASPVLVLLTVGKEDGVKRGFTFTIYRENIFVGKVLVIRLHDASCECRVLFTAPNQQILPGDSAATVLD